MSAARVAVGLIAGCSLAACADAPPSHAVPAVPPVRSPPIVAEGRKDVSSGTPLERFFPLVDGNVYSYRTVDEKGGEGLLIARVFRADEQRGELRYATSEKRFVYVPDGVMLHARGGPGYILKLPLAVGATWRGEHGGVSRILTVNAEIDVAAGHFSGCVQTLEERLGDVPVRYATTFCPDVGIVQIEAAGRTGMERAELKSYGPPVVMREDGMEWKKGPAP